MRKFRFVWIFWLLAFFLVLIALVALFAWVFRASILDRIIQNQLRENGLNGRYSITELARDHVRLTDITIRRNSATLFRGEDVRVDYTFFGFNDLSFDKVLINGATLDVAVDADWKPTEPLFQFRSRSSDGSTEFWPRGGVDIIESMVNITGPNGVVGLTVDALVPTLSQASGTLSVDATEFRYGAVAGTFNGVTDFVYTPETLKLNPVANIENLDRGNMTIRDLSVKGPVIVHRGADVGNVGRAEFDLSVLGGVITTPDVVISDLSTSVVGTVRLPTSEDASPDVNIKMIGDKTRVKLTNAKMVDDLSARLTVYDALNNLTSTRPFADPLRSMVGRLLRDFTVNKALTFQTTAAGFEVTVQDPIMIEGPKLRVSMAPIKTQSGTKFSAQPIYTFDKQTQRSNIAATIGVGGAYAMSLQNLSADINSTTGYDVVGLERFSTRVLAKKTWESVTEGGRPARISDMVADVTYRTRSSRREMDFDGRITFDGDVPGGYVTGLSTQGRAKINLLGDDLTAQFVATPGKPIIIGQFNNATDWTATDMRFFMPEDPLTYARDNQGIRRLKTQVREGRATFSQPASGMVFDVEFDIADVDAGLQEIRQDWDIAAVNARVASETTPGPNTRASAPNVDLAIMMTPDTAPVIRANAPKSTLSTELATFSDVAILAEGTSETMEVNFDGQRLKTNVAGIPVMPMRGTATYENQAWDGRAVTYLPRAKATPITVDFQMQGGQADIDLDIQNLVFSQTGLQPQSLVPALKGKVADVEGQFSADISLQYTDSILTQSRAIVSLQDMNFGTLPGPVTGLNTVLKFTSLMPVQTDGPQTLTVESFDPGLPLDNGVIEFELIPDGIRLYSAVWPLGKGRFYLKPADWIYLATENRMNMMIENISLVDVLEKVKGDSFYATGDMSGELPVVVSGVSVLVENGSLRVAEGGIIQFRSTQTDAAGAANQFAEYAFDALKNFNYDEMELKMNGPLDGEIGLYLVFTGSNPELLGGTPFLFRVNMEGELFNIARSLQSGPAFGSQLIGQLARQSLEGDGQGDEAERDVLMKDELETTVD